MQLKLEFLIPDDWAEERLKEYPRHVHFTVSDGCPDVDLGILMPGKGESVGDLTSDQNTSGHQRDWGGIKLTMGRLYYLNMDLIQFGEDNCLRVNCTQCGGKYVVTKEQYKTAYASWLEEHNKGVRERAQKKS